MAICLATLADLLAARGPFSKQNKAKKKKKKKKVAQIQFTIGQIQVPKSRHNRILGSYPRKSLYSTAQHPAQDIKDTPPPCIYTCRSDKALPRAPEGGGGFGRDSPDAFLACNTQAL